MLCSISLQLDGLATAPASSHRSLEVAINSNTIGQMATPSSSPATPLKMPAHSVAMPTPILQAVYDRNQQPLYILQSPGPSGSSGGPALIPVQGLMTPQQAHQLRGSNAPGTPSLNLPSSLHMDQLAGNKCVTSLQTPPPGTPKGFSGLGAQAFQISAGGAPLGSPQGLIASGPGLDGLLPPSHLLLPHGSNGGTQLSEAGPIRTIVRQAAKERPSPVAMDGENLLIVLVLLLTGC